jgi:endonuclease/exonuclease/phosphatase family metal-dependent hydrolase
MTSTASGDAAPADLGRFRSWIQATTACTVALAAIAAFAPGGAVAAPAHRETFTRPFHVATFNVLGASHTVHGAKGMLPYQKRLRRAVSLVDHVKLSVIGFQELEEAQWSLYKRLTGKKWGFWPGMRLGSGPVRNSVGWRRAIWKRVERHTYEVPYFHGRLVQNPYVKLRNRVTGVEVWFVNTHNPADGHGNSARSRRRSIRIQADLVNRLHATGDPVVFTGDFNDRERAFCRLTRLTRLESVSGGGWRHGRCEVPRHSRIDWIFASKRVRATDYRLRESRVIQRISDHPIVTARIAVPRR